MVWCGWPWRSGWSSSTGRPGAALRLRKQRCNRPMGAKAECDNDGESPPELPRTSSGRSSERLEASVQIFYELARREGPGLCRMLDAVFREHTFYELRCIDL